MSRTYPCTATACSLQPGQGASIGCSCCGVNVCEMLCVACVFARCSLMWWRMGGMYWAAGSRAAAEVFQAPVWPPLLWLEPCACWLAWCLLRTGNLATLPLLQLLMLLLLYMEEVTTSGRASKSVAAFCQVLLVLWESSCRLLHSLRHSRFLCCILAAG